MDGESSERSSSPTDGPSSRLPSTFAAPNTGPDAGTSFSFIPRRSTREIASSMTVPTDSVDPPRPAKQGYEWVWFPGGYWAERMIVEIPTKDPIKMFKRRKRSGKSSSESLKHSPRIPLGNSPPLVDATDRPPSSGQRSLGRTPASSESGGSIFPLNRMPDAPLPSPYLTEETHVQSLQWPSLDAAATSRGISANLASILGPGVGPSPSQPLRVDDNASSAGTNPLTLDRATASDNVSTALVLSPRASGIQEEKEKQPFNWRIRSERWRVWRRHLLPETVLEKVKLRTNAKEQRPKRARVSSGGYDRLPENTGHTPSPRHKPLAKSPLRKESTVSEKSHKSFKSRSTKLLSKVGWSRKVPDSPRASTSKSTPCSVPNSPPSQSPALTPRPKREETPGTPRPHSRTEDRPVDTTPPTSTLRCPSSTARTATASAFASDYPGGEAVRVQTPQILLSSLDRFPRSFFSDLRPPPTPPPREWGPGVVKTALSTSLTPDVRDSSDADSDASVVKTAAAPPPRPREKEWWEVQVPVTYCAVDARPFRFDLPEHLPSSPMCPANRRHVSGGTGVCVYHGRAKGARTASQSEEDVAHGMSQGEDGDVDDGEGGGRENDEFGSDVWR